MFYFLKLPNPTSSQSVSSFNQSTTERADISEVEKKAEKVAIISNNSNRPISKSLVSPNLTSQISKLYTNRKT